MEKQHQNQLQYVYEKVEDTYKTSFVPLSFQAEDTYKHIRLASFLSQLCFLGKFKKYKYKLLYI